jgi:ABC-type transporter Mla subunit MlaD
MKRFAFAAMLSLSVVGVGCNKISSHEKPEATSQHGKVPQSIEQAQRDIELQAQRAKHDIDAVTTAAEDALRNSQNSLNQVKTKVKQSATDLSERAAELAEDAKDRAEDLPEAVDRQSERLLDLRDRERQLQAEEKAIRESQQENR